MSFQSLPISVGAMIKPHQLPTVLGEPVELPGDVLTHVQFRRFAGCPVCNLHLQSIARRHDEISAAGVREVAVFHSSGELLAPHVAALPFAVVPDPDKELYREFGVESSRRALLDPRGWGMIIKGLATTIGPVVAKERPAPSPEGDNLGLPADFLIDSTGRVLAAHYGQHLGDHWSVDDLLDLVRAAVRS